LLIHYLFTSLSEVIYRKFSANEKEVQQMVAIKLKNTPAHPEVEIFAQF